MTGTTDHDTVDPLGWDPVTESAEDDGPIYANLAEWVSHWFAPIVRRRPRVWCARWWDHPEALDRLGTLWVAWEAAQKEGHSAPSYWWVFHFENHWHALTDAREGPFAGCASEHRAAAAPLEIIDPPALEELK